MPVFKIMKIINIIIIFILIVSSAFCEEFVISHNSSLNKKRLRQILNRNNQSIDSLKTYLVNNGYLDAVVTQKNDTIFISERDLFYLEKVLISNDTSQNVINFPFTESNFNKYMEDLLDKFYQKGYLYSEINIDSITRFDRKLNAYLSVNTGPELKVDNIRYMNLKRTSPELLSRYLSVKSGETINKKTLADLESQALRLPFVNFIPPVKIQSQPGYQRADLELSFLEKKQLLFEGAGGIASDNSSSLFWNLNMKFRNIFGGGKNFSLISDHRLKNRQILRITYSQPLFILGIGEWEIDIGTRDYRQQFYEFSLSSKYKIYLNNNSSLGIHGGWRSVEPNGSLPSYQVFESGLLFSNSNLNNKINPSSGWYLNWQLSYLYRHYSNDSLISLTKTSYNEVRNDILVTWYKPIHGKLISYLSFNYLGFETSEDIPPSAELYFIGGPKTLRGFRNEQFTAIRAGLITIEPRMKFNNGYFFVFYDGVYLKNRILLNNNINNEVDYHQGYGLGISIVDNSRLIKLSLGWNKNLPFDNPYLSVEFSSEI